VPEADNLCGQFLNSLRELFGIEDKLCSYLIIKQEEKNYIFDVFINVNGTKCKFEGSSKFLKKGQLINEIRSLLKLTTCGGVCLTYDPNNFL
jgi:hypothetical protein